MRRTHLICTVQGCGQPHHAKGYCSAHRHRASRHGDPLAGDATRTRDLFERLGKWLLVGDGCWLWTGATDQHGYGHMATGPGVTARVHRVVYELLIGPISPGLEPDHLCRIKGCARPDHLDLVTHKVNVQRAYQGPVCRRGHPWTPESTYRRPDGRRECLVCKQARWRSFAARRSEANLCPS